jgi:pectate lyase
MNQMVPRLRLGALILGVLMVTTGCLLDAERVEVVSTSAIDNTDLGDDLDAANVSIIVEDDETLNYLPVIMFNRPASVPAFPGAEGSGAAAVGGRGGQVIEVTNLDDSGPGSLRAAIQARGPRIVVFRIAGTIALDSQLRIEHPYMTIAGQTAPGGGILIKSKGVDGDSLHIATHDVIIRYLRIRVGAGSWLSTGEGSRGDAAAVYGGTDIYNIIFDHVSCSWATDETFSVWANYGGASNITFQYGILAEPLEGHSTNFITGGQTSALSEMVGDVDIHHTLFMNSSHRNPLVKTPTLRFVNNIIYNWGFYATQTVGGVSSDIIGNLYKKGPSSPGNHEVQAATGGVLGGNPSIYIAGNKGPYNSNPAADNWPMVAYVTGENGRETGPLSLDFRRSSPMAAQTFPITADSVLDLETILLPTVGASHRLDQYGNWVANRDAVDERLIQEYQAGRGTISTHEDDVGGFPTIASGTPYQDSDHDGMPDEWENLHGFDPNDPSDGPVDADRDGYTNVEEYLNGTDPRDIL